MRERKIGCGGYGLLGQRSGFVEAPLLEHHEREEGGYDAIVRLVRHESAEVALSGVEVFVIECFEDRFSEVDHLLEGRGRPDRPLALRRKEWTLAAGRTLTDKCNQYHCQDAGNKCDDDHGLPSLG